MAFVTPVVEHWLERAKVLIAFLLLKIDSVPSVIELNILTNK